jgi:ferric iron reductase protein FhuF
MIDRVAPLAAARGHGYGLGLCAAPVPDGEPGWRPATATAGDPALLDVLLARTAAGAGTRSRAVAATWHLEKHAWFVGGAALAGVLVHGAIPPLDRMLLRDGGHGWAVAVAAPADGWEIADGATLAARLEAHLVPVVEALACHRPARALWRSAGDRLGQAAVWCSDAFGDRDAALALARDVLTAPTALRSLATFTERDGRPFRLRAGCCLSHRCAGAVRCDDCPLQRPPGV